MEGDTVIVDGLIELKPIPKGNRAQLLPREVYFPCVTNIITEINKKVSVFAVSYDKWNNTEQIHTLRDRRILAVQKNIIRDDYIRFLNTLRHGNFKFPKPEIDIEKIIGIRSIRNIPVARAIYELGKLEDNGTKVDHPKGLHNDIIECCVGLHRLLVTPELILDKAAIKKNLQSQIYARKAYPKKLGQVIRIRR